jgi:vacuolar-type H+-ATPase subunit D/Vma8
MLNNAELTHLIKEERDRLLKKRPALEEEQARIISAIDKAQFMTSALKEFVRREYNRQFYSLDEQIRSLSMRLNALEAIGNDK